MKAADGRHPVVPVLFAWSQNPVKPLATEPADAALVAQGPVPGAFPDGGHADDGS
jgi:hypothetical protein